MLYQDYESIWQSMFGKHENVAFLFVSLDEEVYEKTPEELKDFIFVDERFGNIMKYIWWVIKKIKRRMVMIMVSVN